MSTVRVLSPVLNDIYNIKGGGGGGGGVGGGGFMMISPARNQQLKRVKRDLFGATNPMETTKLFHDELEKYHELASKKWDFDFRQGKPLDGCNSTKYIWERVSPYEKIIAPDMYTLTRAAHSRPLPADDDITENDLLLDERAGRENAVNDVDSCDDDCVEENDFMLFKVPTIVPKLTVTVTKKPAAIVNIQPMRNKRQPKITEYMKERKRLAVTPQKTSVMKRMRSSLPTAGIKSNLVATSMAKAAYNTPNALYNLHVHFGTRSRH